MTKTLTILAALFAVTVAGAVSPASADTIDKRQKQQAKSIKKGVGDQNIDVTFGGVTFKPEEWIYVDEDGVIVSATPLL